MHLPAAETCINHASKPNHAGLLLLETCHPPAPCEPHVPHVVPFIFPEAYMPFAAPRKQLQVRVHARFMIAQCCYSGCPNAALGYGRHGPAVPDDLVTQLTMPSTLNPSLWSASMPWALLRTRVLCAWVCRLPAKFLSQPFEALHLDLQGRLDAATFEQPVPDTGDQL